MKTWITALCGALALAGGALADAKFEHLTLRLEHNATDQDYEIVIEATGGDTGLVALKLTAPDGRIVFDTQVPQSKLGLRTFRLETSEPKSLPGLQAEFPAGDYSFAASTVNGMGFSGTARLSHRLPAAATLLHPKPDQQQVRSSGLRLQWRAPAGLVACLVTLEDDRSGIKLLQATLPGQATGLQVPDRLLQPATSYKVSVGTVGRDGNATFVESAFVTARQ